MLKPTDLQINQQVVYHPDYQIEEWKDGARSNTLTIKFIFNEGQQKNKHTYYFIGYNCSNPTCRRCNDYLAELKGYGHHQVIDENGNHQYKKIEFIEQKKQTIVKEQDNPVFSPI